MSEQELGSPYHSPWAHLTEAVFDKLHHQDKKWGQREPSHHSPEFWMLIATEEFGEIARAVLAQDSGETKTEIADTIAVLMRLWMWVESFDGDYLPVGHDGELYSAQRE